MAASSDGFAGAAMEAREIAAVQISTATAASRAMRDFDVAGILWLLLNWVGVDLFVRRFGRLKSKATAAWFDEPEPAATCPIPLWGISG